MAEYESRYFTSADGLQLHYRDYNHVAPDAPVVLCLPGLTRNARDFAHVAEQLHGKYRVLCPELRGRGLSQWDTDPSRYTLETYVGDMFGLLGHLELPSVHAIGTSLGGLISAAMATTMPGVIASAIINDIGPVLEETGIKRIQNYVGSAQPCKSWAEATALIRAGAHMIYPHYSEADWEEFTRCIYSQKGDAISLDFDPAIAQPFEQDTKPDSLDLWPLFEGLKGVPTLLLRGGTSDLLSSETARALEARLNIFEFVTVPGVGHAPDLKEPVSRQAIDAFTARYYLQQEAAAAAS